MSLPDHLLTEDLPAIPRLTFCDDGHGDCYHPNDEPCPACTQRIRADTNATYLEQACDLLEQWRMKC